MGIIDVFSSIYLLLLGLNNVLVIIQKIIK